MAHLGRADLGIEQVRHLARDDAVRIGVGPHLLVPVVVRADQRQRKLGVLRLALQALAREAQQGGREVDRRVDTVDVHVGDPGVDIPCPAAHFVETGGLEARLDDGPSDDGVESDVRILLAFEAPVLAAVRRPR